MGFEIAQQQHTATSGTGGTSESTTDWNALQAYTIEQCKTKDKQRIIPGYIVGYNDLGLQKRKPYTTEYDPNDARMKESVDKGEATVTTGNLYDNDKGKWLNDIQIFTKPLPPRKACAFTVAFPQITLDTATFHGEESNPRPLMMVMGGEFFADRIDGSDGKKEKIIQDLTFLQENTNNPSGNWGYGTNTNLHKMGAAAELLDANGLFTSKRLGELLGKPLQFRMRIWDKPNAKDPSKTWYTEDIKFISEVPEGLPIPELDPKYIHGFNMYPKDATGSTPEGVGNDPETIKHLRGHIVNTCKRATDYEGSVLEQEFNTLRGGNSNSQQTPQEPHKAPSTPSQGVSGTNGTGNGGMAQSGPTGQPQQQYVPEPIEDFDLDVPF